MRLGSRFGCLSVGQAVATVQDSSGLEPGNFALLTQHRRTESAQVVFDRAVKFRLSVLFQVRDRTLNPSSAGMATT